MAETETQLVDQLKDHVERTRDLLERTDFAAVSALVEKLHEAYEAGRRVFIFGNGGSGATASHICEDLAKGVVPDLKVEKRLRVLSLTDSVPFISALGNDCGFETVFREQLITLAEPGDIAIALSGSGNSPNIVTAVEWATKNKLFTVGLSGFNGGKLKGMVDLSVHVPILDMEVAENCHMVIGHMMVGGLRRLIAEASEQS